MGARVVAAALALAAACYTPVEVTGDGSGSGSAITAFDATQLVAGNAYACMLGGSDGRELRCWGHDEVGELGIGDSGQPDVVPLATVVPGAWQQVSAGLHHACAIDTSGKLFCWGNNTSNEVVPKGGSGAIFAPVEIVAAGSPAWKQVAAGGSHTCAIAIAGQLLCWGDMNVLGIEDAAGFASFAVPGSAPTASPDWERVAASRDDVCAVSTSRGVFCFGAENQFGKLGSGSLGSRSMVPPTAVPFPQPISALAMGLNVTCAIANGGLECVGDNNDGGIDPGTPRSSAAQPLPNPTPVLGSASPATGWTAVSVGAGYTCAISNTGELYCWGTQSHGGMGDGDYFSAAPTAEDIGSNATLIAVGDFNDPTYAETDFIDLIDLELTCATLGGRNTCWGDDRYGELGNGRATLAAVPVQATSGVAELAVGLDHVCTRALDGSVACWGNNAAAAVGANDDDCAGAGECSASTPKPFALAEAASDLVSGWSHSCARGATSQTLTCWGDDRFGQSTPDGALYSAGGLFAGANATCALPVGSDVPTCFGALYVPSTSPYPTPIGASAFPEFGDLTAMALGGDFGCVERAGGRWCVGDNSHGQFGSGGTDGGSPKELISIDTAFPVVRASATGEFACGLGSAGGVSCWGQNTIGQLGTGKPSVADLGLPQEIDTDPCEALTVGEEHGCAICAGQVLCWGRNQFGQLGLGAADVTISHGAAMIAATPGNMSPWTDIQAGTKFTCGLRADNTVWCWGLGVSGELANGAKTADTPLQGGVELAP